MDVLTIRFERRWMEEDDRKMKERKIDLEDRTVFIHRMEAVLCPVYVTTRTDGILRDKCPVGVVF